MLQADWAGELSLELPPGPIVELCSGVGHIGQAAAVLSGRDLVQVDVEHRACALAEANATRNGIRQRVEVRCGDIGTGLRAGERFPLVLADPPYLTSDEVGGWPDDPQVAIDGGDDGLDLQRRCITAAAAHVLPEGVVLLQARGRAQIAELQAHIRSSGLECVEIRDHDERRAVARLRLRPE